MYFWNINELVDKLSQETPPQWEVAKYLIATTIIFNILGGAYYDPSEFTLSKLVLNSALACVGGLGVYYCFKINHSIDNKDFISRFTILTLPVALRWVVITSLGYIVIYMTVPREIVNGPYFEVINGIYVISLEVMYFSILAFYLRKIGSSTK
jgi:hypothetical protein